MVRHHSFFFSPSSSKSEMPLINSHSIILKTSRMILISVLDFSIMRLQEENSSVLSKSYNYKYRKNIHFQDFKRCCFQKVIVFSFAFPLSQCTMQSIMPGSQTLNETDAVSLNFEPVAKCYFLPTKVMKTLGAPLCSMQILTLSFLQSMRYYKVLSIK